MPDRSLLLVLPVVLLVSPAVLAVASRQDRATKRALRGVWLALLLTQWSLGWSNWETFSGVGRSGFALAYAYPRAWLSAFFTMTGAQIVLLLIRRRVGDIAAIVLNAIVSVSLIGSLIAISRHTHTALVGWGSLGAVGAVLVGNVVGLCLINQRSV